MPYIFITQKQSLIQKLQTLVLNKNIKEMNLAVGQIGNLNCTEEKN